MGKIFYCRAQSKKPYGYNLTDGGEGTVGLERTPEHRAKLAASKRGKNNPSYGNHPSNETRAKRSASLKGRRFSEEHRAKLAAAHRGRTLSPEHRAKIAATERGNNPFKNLLYEMEMRQLTYKALSKLIEMPLSSLSCKMQGVRKFTEGDKVKLEKFFGKPIKYLLARDAAKEV